MTEETQPGAVVDPTSTTLHTGAPNPEGSAPSTPRLQPPPNTPSGALGCTLGLEMWFVPSRAGFKHLCDIPVHGGRKKLRGSTLEPESNPHGIQADWPKYSPNIRVAPSSFELQRMECGCVSSGGEAERVLLQQRKNKFL